MKKIILIIFGISFILVTSCNKKAIRPNLENSEFGNHDFSGGSIYDKNNSSNNPFSSSTTVATRSLDSLFKITDPNRDEDEERRGKNK